MVLAGNVFEVEGDGLHDVVVSVYGYDVNLVSVCTDYVRYMKNDHCIIGAPGFGVCVEPNS